MKLIIRQKVRPWKYRSKHISTRGKKEKEEIQSIHQSTIEKENGSKTVSSEQLIWLKEKTSIVVGDPKCTENLISKAAVGMLDYKDT